MKLQNLLGTSAFILSLAGCEGPQSPKPNLAEEYNSKPAAFTEKAEAISCLYCKICLNNSYLWIINVYHFNAGRQQIKRRIII